MSTRCSTFPTLTSTSVATTDSISTSFSERLITAEASTSTILSTTCLASVTVSGVATCDRVSTETILSTIPGGVSTTSIPVITTIPILSTRTTTLFGTSCTTIDPGNGGQSGNSGNSGNSTGNSGNSGNNGNNGNNGSSNNGTTAGGVDQGPHNGSVVTHEQSTTLPNGQVSVVTVTSTSYLIDPSQNTSTGGDGGGGGLQSSNGKSSSNNSIGAIVGGAVGGFFGLLGLVLIVWFMLKRRRRWDDIFEKDLDQNPYLNGGATNLNHGSSYGSGKSKGRFSLGPDLDSSPKPYQYGLVGHGTNGDGNMPVQNNNLLSRPSTANSTQPLASAGLTPSNSSHPASPLYAQPQNYSPSHSPSPSIGGVPLVPTPWIAQGPAADERDFGIGPRAGSPVSFTEQSQGRKLQVANYSPPSIYSGHQRMTSDGSDVSIPRGLSVANSDVTSPVGGSFSSLPGIAEFTTSGADTSRGMSNSRDVKPRKSSSHEDGGMLQDSELGAMFQSYQNNLRQGS